MIDTILFDFDGTLVDSEPNYAESDCRMVAHFGGNLSLKEHEEFVGWGSDRFLTTMKERYKITATREKMKKVQTDFYLELARDNTKVFPIMAELLEQLKKRNITMAVASGTPPIILEELVVQTGLSPYFSLILSAETTGRSKPEPHVFLKAAELLKKKAENCLVLEDSISGAQAGVKAGMKTIALVSPYHRDRLSEYPREAHLVKGGVAAFRTELVLSRVCEPNS
jgi:HAD superfamily hydrolase (TIGR01509 family)